MNCTCLTCANESKIKDDTQPHLAECQCYLCCRDDNIEACPLRYEEKACTACQESREGAGKSSSLGPSCMQSVAFQSPGWRWLLYCTQGLFRPYQCSWKPAALQSFRLYRPLSLPDSDSDVSVIFRSWYCDAGQSSRLATPEFKTRLPTSLLHNCFVYKGLGIYVPISSKARPFSAVWSSLTGESMHQGRTQLVFL